MGPGHTWLWRVLVQKSEVILMLRELTKNDWQRILAIPDESIPQVLILRGTDCEDHQGT